MIRCPFKFKEKEKKERTKCAATDTICNSSAIKLMRRLVHFGGVTLFSLSLITLFILFASAIRLIGRKLRYCISSFAYFIDGKLNQINLHKRKERCVSNLSGSGSQFTSQNHIIISQSERKEEKYKARDSDQLGNEDKTYFHLWSFTCL